MSITGGLRISLAVGVVMCLGPGARAQIVEPILAKSPMPFAPGAGSLKLDFASGIGPAGGSSQILPEAMLEVGVRDGWEALVRFPLIRVNRGSPGETVLGGGQLAMGARYLLIGSPERKFAFSVQGIIEAPTGATHLVGNATQAMPAVLAEWRPVRRAVVDSNLTFDRSLGGTGPRSSFVAFSNAVTWVAASHLLPAFEVSSSTDTIAGRTRAIALPEVIVPIGLHWQWKAGYQVGLNPAAPQRGVRVQVAWLWGNRP